MEKSGISVDAMFAPGNPTVRVAGYQGKIAVVQDSEGKPGVALFFPFASEDAAGRCLAAVAEKLGTL